MGSSPVTPTKKLFVPFGTESFFLFRGMIVNLGTLGYENDERVSLEGASGSGQKIKEMR